MWLGRAELPGGPSQFFYKQDALLGPQQAGAPPHAVECQSETAPEAGASEVFFLPKISVIVPVYKVEPYLARCVNSILNQTFHDLEIILVDDGSPDGCGALCDAYARQDSRVQVIHKPNGGLSSARNAGIERAKSAYLAFVDSDDWLDLDMLEQLHTLCEQRGADIAECSYRSIYQDGIREETLCTGRIIEAGPVEAIDGILDWKHFKSVAWNKLYRREVIGAIRYPEGMLHEDEFTTYRYFYAAKKLVYLDVSKYNYDRSRTDSITGDVFREANLDSCIAMRQRREFLLEHRVDELEEKANNVYCWLLLDRLYSCYKHNITGPKVKKVLQMAREDVEYYRAHPVEEQYRRQLELIARKGLKAYGRMRRRQEQGV